MFDLTTALKQGAEAYRKLRAEPPKTAATSTSATDILAPAPAGLALPPDDLQLPAPLAAASDHLVLPSAAPLGFAPVEAPLASAVPAADPVDALEDALRHRLRRYPSIHRKEELL